MVIEDCVNLVSDTTEKADEVSESFSDWLKINKKYFLFIFSILPLAINYYGKIFGNKGSWIYTKAQDMCFFIAITAAIQCIFILFAIFLQVKEKLFLADRDRDKEPRESQTDKTCDTANDKKPGTDERKANIALMQFKSAWIFLWTSWFLLYLTLFIKYFCLSKPGTSFLKSFIIPNEKFANLDANLQIFLNLFNNSSAAIFMICYFIFATITVPDNKSSEYPQKQTSMDNNSGKFPLKLAIGLSVIIVILFGIIDYLSNIGITKWVSSILAGIAMAFFLGRLNNKFINPSTSIIVCLYAYMAIQTLFPFWQDSSESFIILLSANLAFIFKIVLYLFMLWLFRSGRLLFYLKKERKLIQSVNKDWDRFELSGVLITLPITNNKISGNN